MILPDKSPRLCVICTARLPGTASSDHVGAFDGLGLRRRRRAVARLRDEVLDVLLVRRARAVDDRVAERGELGPERGADVAGADDGDLRGERRACGNGEQRERRRKRLIDAFMMIPPGGADDFSGIRFARATVARNVQTRRRDRPRLDDPPRAPRVSGPVRPYSAGSRRITAPSGRPLP